MTHRVLVTGVSRLWGAALAARLEADPDVDEIVAVDADQPARQLARTQFVRADIRHSLVGKLVRALGIDTVVHAGTIVDTRNASPRQVHETNVIGTMNLLAACGGPDSPVRTLIVKSSTALYGARHDAPSFWSESMTRPRPSDAFARDLEEMEAYVSDFAARQPEIAVSVLRFADVLGASDQTPFAAYFGLSAVPTVLGFDPRLQFVHEDDVVAALHHAVRTPWRGVANVAGGGVVVLSQAISMLGAINVPVLPFAGASLVGPLLRRAGVLPLSDHLIPVIQHGRVVDTTVLREQFGFEPQTTSVECVARHAKWRRTHAIMDDGDARPSDLEAFLRSRAQPLLGDERTPTKARRRVAAAPRKAAPTPPPARPRKAAPTTTSTPSPRKAASATTSAARPRRPRTTS